MRRSLAAFISLLILIPCASADDGRWSSSGPYGGEVFALEINPVTPATMYALTKGGLFKTTNTGGSWQRAESGIIGSAAAGLPMLLDRDEPDTLYVFDEDGRLYVTRDGAASWRWSGIAIGPNDVHVTDLADIPGNSGSFFLSARKSETAGPIVTPMAIRIQNYGVSASNPPVFGAGLPNDRSVLALAVNPANPLQVLVGLESYPQVTGPAQPSIFVSNDGGLNFSAAYSGPATATNTPYVFDLAFGPGGRAFALMGGTESQTLYFHDGAFTTPAPGNAGGWLETTAQVTRTSLPEPAAQPQNCFLWPRALAPSPVSNGVVFAGSTDGMRRFNITTTSGNPVPVATTLLATGLTANATPQAGTPGPLAIPPCDIELSPDFPGAGSRIYAATIGGGLMRTIDGGDGESTGFSQFALDQSNNGLAGTHLRGLVIDPTAPGALLAGIGDSYWGSMGIFRANGGNWTVANAGLGATQLRQITIDPTTTANANTMRVYAVGRAPLTEAGVLGDPNAASYRNFGIYRSIDGGQNWTTRDGDLPLSATTGGTPTRDLGIVRKLIFDPRSCGAPPWPSTGPVCAVGSGPLQRFYAIANGRQIDVDDAMADTRTRFNTHRVLRSDDGGATYVDLSNNPGFPPSVHIIQKLTAPFTQYYRSILTPNQIVVDPVDSRRLWVSTFMSPFDLNPSGGPEVPDVAQTILYSSDGGATWSVRATGLPLRPGYVNVRQDAFALAQDPTNANTLWASQTVTSGPTTFMTATIWKTVDGGLNWTLSDNGAHDVADIRAIEVDPLNPQVLLATGSGSESNPASIFRSRDGGANWKSISVGLPANGGATIAFDPVDTLPDARTESSTIHVGTNAGVWSITQAPDFDDDGISDEDEGGLGPPEGFGGRDSNGDTIPDAQQRQVGGIGVSIHRPTGASSVARTTAVQRGLSVPNGGANDCLQAVDVQDFRSFQFGRDELPGSLLEFSYGYDLRRIEVLNCSKAVIDFIYQGSDFGREYGWTFRYHGPQIPGEDESIGWHGYTAKSVLLPAQSYDPTHQTTWRVTVDANSFGSYRPLPDRVLFLGGPACLDDRLFRNGMETAPDSGPASCAH